MNDREIFDMFEAAGFPTGYGPPTSVPRLIRVFASQRGNWGTFTMPLNAIAHDGQPYHTQFDAISLTGYFGAGSNTCSVTNVVAHLDCLTDLFTNHNWIKSRRGRHIPRQARREKKEDILKRWEAQERAMWENRSDRPVALVWGTGHTREWWAIAASQEDFEETIETDLTILRGQQRRNINKDRSTGIKGAITDGTSRP